MKQLTEEREKITFEYREENNNLKNKIKLLTSKSYNSSEGMYKYICVNLKEKKKRKKNEYLYAT